MEGLHCHLRAGGYTHLQTHPNLPVVDLGLSPGKEQVLACLISSESQYEITLSFTSTLTNDENSAVIAWESSAEDSWELTAPDENEHGIVLDQRHMSPSHQQSQLFLREVQKRVTWWSWGRAFTETRACPALKFLHLTRFQLLTSLEIMIFSNLTLVKLARQIISISSIMVLTMTCWDSAEATCCNNLSIHLEFWMPSLPLLGQ